MRELDRAPAPAGPRVRMPIRGRRLMGAVVAAVVVIVAAVVLGAVTQSPSSPGRHRPPPATGAPSGSHASTSSGTPEPSVSPTPTTRGPSTYGSSASAATIPGSPAEKAAGAPTGSGASGGGTQSASALPSGMVGQPARVEKTGSASLSVGNGGVGRAMSALSNLAVANGGFVASSSVQSGPPPVPVPLPAGATGTTGSPGATSSSDSPATTGSITLQIAEADYETVVGSLGSVGRVTALNTKATDVSGQYADLQARITALQASRQQYLTIMTKATSVGDILAVQAQIDQIQSQLDQLQGQQQLLDSQTTYGTLAVTVNAATPVVHRPPRPGPGTGIGAAWHDAVHGFVAGAEGIVRISGPLLFALLCLGMLLLIGWALWRVAARRRAM